jgi:hypothetical protein
VVSIIKGKRLNFEKASLFSQDGIRFIL